ncbi:MAG: hypothetical protein AB8B95_03980 [Pseudohongiellaceae bacterium]
MSLLSSASATFKTRLLPVLPQPVKVLFEQGSAKHLLTGINRQLVLVNDELLDISSGRSNTVLFKKSDGTPEQTIAQRSAAIAACARSLAEQSNEGGILLYLPPNEFVSTSISMPGVSKDNLIAALKLQAENLFPSIEKSLSLTLGNESGDGSGSIALWFAEEFTTELFKAFEKENLFLIAVAPRNLIHSESSSVVDYDSEGATLVELEGGAITSWLHINQLDLQDEKLNQQWREALSLHLDDQLLTLDCAESFKALTPSGPPTEHCYITDGALSLQRRVQQKRNIAFTFAGVMVFLLLGAVPFMVQSFQFRTMEAQLREQRESSATARENRGVVVNFESDWGAITDFPVQDVQEAMFTLQEILQPDQLASFELSEGVIKIQGTSSEPQAILQRLEQDPIFTEVVFSRATNNSRYYIDLRLSTVNFEGYMVRHFPDA